LWPLTPWHEIYKYKSLNSLHLFSFLTKLILLENVSPKMLPNSLGIWPDNILLIKFLKTPTRIRTQNLHQQCKKNFIDIIWYWRDCDWMTRIDIGGTTNSPKMKVWSHWGSFSRDGYAYVLPYKFIITQIRINNLNFMKTH